MIENDISDVEEVAVLKDADLDDMKSLIASHSKWIDHVGRFMIKEGEGMTISQYCKANDLPTGEFSKFYNLAMQDMARAIEKSPFLAKLASLPVSEQEEYQRLIKEKNEKIGRLCSPLSKLLGRKIRFEDLFRTDDSFDRIMKEALKPTLTKRTAKPMWTS